MRPRSLFSSAALVCAALWFAPAVLAAGAPLDTARIEQLTGLKGTLNQKEGVFKVSFPRKDIQATIAGVRMVPDLASLLGPPSPGRGTTAWSWATSFCWTQRASISHPKRRACLPSRWDCHTTSVTTTKC